MSAAHAEPPSADGLVARLDEMLAELAGAAADSRPAPDAARIDRIARLEKLRAVTAALQAAESVRFAQSQGRRTARRRCASQQDRPRYCRTDRTCLSHLASDCRPQAQYHPRTVV